MSCSMCITLPSIIVVACSHLGPRPVGAWFHQLASEQDLLGTSRAEQLGLSPGNGPKPLTLSTSKPTPASQHADIGCNPKLGRSQAYLLQVSALNALLQQCYQAKLDSARCSLGSVQRWGPATKHRRPSSGSLASTLALALSSAVI